MAVESLALGSNVVPFPAPRTRGIPSLRGIRFLLKGTRANPFAAAATMAVLDAHDEPDDWLLCLFAGPAGELKLVDLLGSCEQPPTGFEFACAVPRPGLSDLSALSRAVERVAWTLSNHFIQRGLPV